MIPAPSPARLLVLLSDLGCWVRAVDGKLRVEAPEGVLTVDLRTSVSLAKAELLNLAQGAESCAESALDPDPARRAAFLLLHLRQLGAWPDVRLGELDLEDGAYLLRPAEHAAIEELEDPLVQLLEDPRAPGALDAHFDRFGGWLPPEAFGPASEAGPGPALRWSGRAWAKGSARGEGGQARTGKVLIQRKHLDPFGGVWEPHCKCGEAMKRCPHCELYGCSAPGHQHRRRCPGCGQERCYSLDPAAPRHRCSAGCWLCEGWGDDCTCPKASTSTTEPRSAA